LLGPLTILHPPPPRANPANQRSPIPSSRPGLRIACAPPCTGAAPQRACRRFTLLLRTGHWLTARYALAVLPWAAIGEPSGLLPLARQGVRSRFFTVPFLLQVGFYLVVVGPASVWSKVAPEVTADHTSLHAVIVQAIHFVDLNTRASVVNRSQWGPVRFGGTTGVSDAVLEVLGRKRGSR
jgi:hypothetical protein